VIFSVRKYFLNLRHNQLLHNVSKIVCERILSCDAQGVCVKCFIVVEKGVDIEKELPPIVVKMVAKLGYKVSVEYPVYQVVLVFKVVIKAIPVQAAVSDNIADANL